MPKNLLARYHQKTKKVFKKRLVKVILQTSMKNKSS